MARGAGSVRRSARRSTRARAGVSERHPQRVGFVNRRAELAAVVLGLVSLALPARAAEPRPTVARALGGAFFGLGTAMGSVHDQEAYFWRFDFGTLVYPSPSSNRSHALVVDFAGSWLDNTVTVSDGEPPRIPISMRYGGIALGYAAFTDAIVHPSVQLLGAAGQLSLADPRGRATSIVVVEPMIDAQVQLTDWMKMGLGVSHRFVSGVDVGWSSNREVTGLAFHGLLRLGQFR